MYFLKRVFLLSVTAVLLLSACGKDDKTASDPAVMDAISDYNVILQTTDRQTLVGRKVNLDGVPVQTVAGTYVFWAGDSHLAIPVFRKDQLSGNSKDHVRVGGKCRMNGVIRLAENVPAADPMWQKINEEEKREILNAKIFIEADSVQAIN